MIDTLRYIWTHPLARRSRFEALTRYARWQLGARFLGWPAVVPFVANSHLVVERSMHGATGNIYCGLHEFVDMAFLLHFLRPEDRFVDVGANIGSYTILASAVVGASSVSIEPVPATFALFERNVRINDIGRLVTAVNCALGRQQDTCLVSVDQGTQNKVVGSDYAGDTANILVQQLDAVLNNQPTTMWKVDVEGYELEVLEGARRSIKDESLQAVILESHSEPIRQIMQSHGFRLCEYDPWQRKVTLLARNDKVAGNYLWIRGLEETNSRCERGSTYSVLSVSI
jgi:FkbM family methyltransferase